MNKNERISHQTEDPEAWICICGNVPWDDGFYPCDENGREVEPVAGWEGLYVCATCGRIIDVDTLDVVGKRVSPSSEAAPTTLGEKLDDLLASFERIEKRLLEMKESQKEKN